VRLAAATESQNAEYEASLRDVAADRDELEDVQGDLAFLSALHLSLARGSFR